MHKLKSLLLLLVFGLFCATFDMNAQNNSSDISFRTTDRIENIIKNMTLSEKMAMLQGAPGIDNHIFNGIERLGIPTVKCANGPRGLAGAGNTAFPNGTAFGACWNPVLVEKIASVIGKEAKSVGTGVLLGPSVNIIRDPLCGRNFEYFTEDPMLNATITSAFVRGLQNEQVIACVKHFACNNREFNRGNYKAKLDDRTLREIYLPAFKAAVDAGALSLMTAANGVNDEMSSDSKILLQDILKDEWGFKGFVITDWCKTKSTEKAAFAGLDISMPYHEKSLYGTPLLKAVETNRVPMHIIDDKIRRILFGYDFLGVLDSTVSNKKKPISKKEHYILAKEIAEESMVLLKNKKNTLPLDISKLKKIVVMGPNSNQRFCLAGLGGSSWVEAPYEISALQGIKNAAGDKVEVKYISTDEVSGFKLLTADDLYSEGDNKGFKAMYYSKGDSKNAINRLEKKIDFVWEMASPDPSISRDNFYAEYSWKIKPTVSGSYLFRITADDNAKLHNIERGGAPVAIIDSEKGNATATAVVQMEVGQTYTFKLAYTEKTGDAMCRVEWATPQQNEGYAAALAKIDAEIKDADAVVFVGGIDHNLDSEGRDKANIDFPENQEKLINHIAKVVPNTIVTIISGGQIKLGGWIKNVPAVIEAWYPGMEGGTALANIIFGKVNPSGRLPFTWVNDLNQLPMYQSETQNKDSVNYVEGVFVGYRFFESKNIKPMFPFGFGLSYTNFKYSNIAISTNSFTDKEELIITANVKNIGKVEGSETAQLYIHDKKSTVDRPIRELKGFDKVSLQANESKTVTFKINAADLAFYDETTKSWKTEVGDYEAQIGSSSHNIHLKKRFELK